MRTDYMEFGPWGARMRSLRSNRPRPASKGARAKTYSAGLEQAEQLWTASATVGPVASPMLLFYGLAQAGRALCAGTPGRWETAEKHGLTFKLTRPKDGAVADLSKVTVEPYGSGLIQHVAQVLNSPVLKAGASLTDLVSCLDSELYFDEHLYSRPRPVEVHEDNPYTSIAEPSARALVLSPVPTSWHGKAERSWKGGDSASAPPSADEVEAWLATYPRLRALGKPTGIGELSPSVDIWNRHRWSLRVMWDIEDGGRVPSQTQWVLNQVDVADQREPGRASGYVMPTIGGNADAQHLLVTWWLVLYCLSMLSRYYPDVWTKLLDADSSELAVPLEHLIAVARNRIPELIFEAIDNLRSSGTA